MWGLNIYLLEESTYQKALLSLLLSNNLQNKVSCRTRVTSNTYSLLYVMIKNKNVYHSTTSVIEMGFSDHFPLFISIFVHSPSSWAKYVENGFSQKIILQILRIN
jgi:hypothetical protein